MPRRLSVPRIIALAPGGCAEPGVVVAACRAGALGAFDFGIDFSAGLAIDAAVRAAQFVRRPFGLRLPAAEIQATLLKGIPDQLTALIGTEADGADWSWAFEQSQMLRRVLLAEVTTLDSAVSAAASRPSGLILTGLEAGGLTGSHSAPELLRGVIGLDLGLPLWVRGGIGPASAAALLSAGAHGVVLDGALLLARESPLPAETQARLRAGVAEESLFLGQAGRERYRVILHSPGLIERFARDDSTSPSDSCDAASSSHPRELPRADGSSTECSAANVTREGIGPGFDLAELRSCVGWETGQAWPGGLDACFAAALAAKFPTVGGIVQEVERSLHAAGDATAYDGMPSEEFERDSRCGDVAIVGVALRGRGVASAKSYWRSLVLDRNPIAPSGESSNEVSIAEILREVWRAAGHGDEARRDLLKPKEIEIGPGCAVIEALGQAVHALKTRTVSMVALAGRGVGLTGAIALRRLGDAERDGDRILALLRATATTVASADGAVEETVERLLGAAGVGPSEVDLVDFAGVPGARTDLSWATTILSNARPHGRRAVFGSIPGTASALPGLIELIRASMALVHAVLPATSGLSMPGVAVALEHSPLPVSAQAQPWTVASPQTPRRALIGEQSSGHRVSMALLESYQDDPLPQPTPVEIWPIEWAGVETRAPSGSTKPRVAWLFADLSATPANLRELAIFYPEVRGLLEAADWRLTAMGAAAAGEWLVDASADRSPTAAPRTSTSSPAAWVVSCSAFARLLRLAGVEPDAVAGVGAGELIARQAAGAISLDELLSMTVSSAGADAPFDDPRWSVAGRSDRLAASSPARGRCGARGFDETLAAIHADGARVLIDFSVDGPLAAEVARVLGDRPYQLVRLAPRGGSVREWLEALTELAAAGLPIRHERSTPPFDFDSPAPEPPLTKASALPRAERSELRIDPFSSARRDSAAALAVLATPRLARGRTLATFQESMRSFLIEQRDALLAQFADQGVRATDEVEVGPLYQEDDAKRWTRLCWRFNSAPLPTARGGLTAGGVVLLTDDGRGIGRAVAADLRASGHPVVRVRHGVSEPGVEGVNLCSEAAVSALVERARVLGGIAAIVHLVPLRALSSWTDMSLSGWTSRFGPEVRGLFLLARAAADDLERSADQGGAALIAASALGGTFGLDGRSSIDGFPGQGALRGFVRGLGHASSPVRIRAVDFDASEDVEVLGAYLVREILTRDRSPAVGYRQGRRSAARIAASPRQERAFKPNGPILITGRSIGLIETLAAEFSRSTGQLTLALVVSRDPPDEVVNRWLASPAESGIRRAYAVAGDAAALDELIDDWEQEHASISLVVHARGSFDDPLESESALDHFDRVINSQIEEALRLLNVAGVRSCPTVVLASGSSESQTNEVLIHDVTGALNDALASWLSDRGKRRALAVRVNSDDAARWPALILEELGRDGAIERAVSFETAPPAGGELRLGSDES